MTFEDISAGTAVFIDANVFVYHYEPHPVLGPPCARLLLRIENRELEGFTSAHVLADVAHRIMTLEAAMRFHRPWQGIASWLEQHPADIQGLFRHRSVIDDLTLIGIRILSVTGRLVSRAADASVQFGLLTNDALVVTVMQAHGLSHLASHDTDFDRVPGLARYAPV